jgi:hypothetical protein
MSIVRVGATKQYSDNWDNIFSGSSRKASTKKPAAPARKSAKKTGNAPAKAGAKKRAGVKRKRK